MKSDAKSIKMCPAYSVHGRKSLGKDPNEKQKVKLIPPALACLHIKEQMAFKVL